jgi:hypothetical protein
MDQCLHYRHQMKEKAFYSHLFYSFHKHLLLTTQTHPAPVELPDVFHKVHFHRHHDLPLHLTTPVE